MIRLMLVALIASLASSTARSQDRMERFFGVAAGMGVGSHSAPSLVDYINTVAQPLPGQQLDEFSSEVEFFVAPELQIDERWILALEYSAMVKFHIVAGRSGVSRSEFSYVVHMPTILLHHLVPGEGYRLKFGGGAGYHVGQLEQYFAEIGSRENLTAQGIGIKLEAVGHTMFDESFYGLIGVDLRWGFLGVIRRADGSEVKERGTSAPPKMSFFSIGLKLGFVVRLL
jgi:hypothetical protein